MTPADFLTLRSNPRPDQPRLEVSAAPLLELAYVYYRLQRPDRLRNSEDLPWLTTLLRDHGPLLAELEALEGELADADAGLDLLWMVCHLGYVRDPDTERFFADEATVLARASAELLKVIVQDQAKQQPDQQPDQQHAKDQAKQQLLQRRLARLQTPGMQQRWFALLRRLWTALLPLWQTEGVAAVQEATVQFLQRFEAEGEVLAALPQHHFVQFESSVDEIRRSERQGRLVIVPLFFAAGGGFNLDLHEAHYIGYGINSEKLHAHLTERVGQLALQMKTLGDPTRLMLVTLIARYQHFALTVSDLASQLAISQPTASGHLKLLREAGLVEVERKGTRSLYRVNHQALGLALESLRSLLLSPTQK
jgi:DNA-binding transcriptional ArsR family regulator